MPRLAPSCTPYVIAAYFADEYGQLTPNLPDVGPCGVGHEDACRLGVHHRRERKTGPCFPLTVMQCRAHGRAFTLYPPGHVPYGRRAVVPVSFDGGRVDADEGQVPYHATVFDAALDAAGGQPWHRDEPTGKYRGGGSDRWWSTQGRRLLRLARLTGVAPDLGPRQRAQISDVLVVALLLLLEHARLILEAPGYRTRGAAITAVMAALPRTTPRVAERLAKAGHVAGLWGWPYRWEASEGRLRSLMSHHGGGRDPPGT